jgi:hypothetical protein
LNAYSLDIGGSRLREQYIRSQSASEYKNSAPEVVTMVTAGFLMPPDTFADRKLLPEPGKLLPQRNNPSLGNRDSRMHLGKFIFRVVPVGLLLCSLRTSAQQLHSSAGVAGGDEGSLTVTLTVVSSVGLVVGPDGEQRLIVANAADPRDNVSRLETVAVKMTPVAEMPKVKKKKR